MPNNAQALSLLLLTIQQNEMQSHFHPATILAFLSIQSPHGITTPILYLS